MIGSGSGVCLIPTDVFGMPYPGIWFIKIKEKLAPIHFAAVWRQGDNRLIIASLLNMPRVSIQSNCHTRRPIAMTAPVS